MLILDDNTEPEVEQPINQSEIPKQDDTAELDQSPAQDLTTDHSAESEPDPPIESSPPIAPKPPTKPVKEKPKTDLEKSIEMLRQRRISMQKAGQVIDSLADDVSYSVSRS